MGVAQSWNGCNVIMLSYCSCISKVEVLQIHKRVYTQLAVWVTREWGRLCQD